MAAANTKKRLAAAANRPRLLVYRLYSHSLAHIAQLWAEILSTLSPLFICNLLDQVQYAE
jgi:hypothetical protein